MNSVSQKLQDGLYKDPLDVYEDLSLVFWNALYYNEPASQIYKDAETLKVMSLPSLAFSSWPQPSSRLVFCFVFLTQSAFENEWRARTVLPAPSRTSPPPTSPQKVHSQLASQQPQPESVVTPAPPPVTLVASVNSATTAQQPPTRINTPLAPTVSSPVPQQATTPASNMQQQQQQQQQPGSPPRMSSPDMDVDVGGTPEPENMGADDMARDGESDLVVQQLERGLPRWEGFGDFRWLKETEGSEDRWLELVLAIKGHKDAVYVSLYPSFLCNRTSQDLPAAIAMRSHSRRCQRRRTSPTCPLAYVTALCCAPGIMPD